MAPCRKLCIVQEHLDGSCPHGRGVFPPALAFPFVQHVLSRSYNQGSTPPAAKLPCPDLFPPARTRALTRTLDAERIRSSGPTVDRRWKKVHHTRTTHHHPPQAQSTTRTTLHTPAIPRLCALECCHSSPTAHQVMLLQAVCKCAWKRRPLSLQPRSRSRIAPAHRLTGARTTLNGPAPLLIPILPLHRSLASRLLLLYLPIQAWPRGRAKSETSATLPSCRPSPPGVRPARWFDFVHFNFSFFTSSRSCWCE